MKNTRVHHWRYNNGIELRGWHCWVFTKEEADFEAWMKKNMKGEYDCTWRFNSGDPMISVFIKEDEDATLFKLIWL